MLTFAAALLILPLPGLPWFHTRPKPVYFEPQEQISKPVSKPFRTPKPALVATPLWRRTPANGWGILKAGDPETIRPVGSGR